MVVAAKWDRLLASIGTNTVFFQFELTGKRQKYRRAYLQSIMQCRV